MDYRNDTTSEIGVEDGAAAERTAWLETIPYVYTLTEGMRSIECTHGCMWGDRLARSFHAAPGQTVEQVAAERGLRLVAWDKLRGYRGPVSLIRPSDGRSQHLAVPA